jgi:MATE family multidrug resistance protein
MIGSVQSRDLRTVWRLAAPMIVSNVSIACLGLVDTAVLAHLDAPYYLGAVALATVIFNLLYWGLGFLRMGTTGLVAQQHGASKIVDVVVVQALGLAAVLASALLALQIPIRDVALPLLDGSDDVQRLAAVYFDCKIWGAPAALGVMVLVGALIGLHRPRTTLLLVVIMNTVNIVLDLLFVIGFGWNVKGVAWASVIAEYCGLFLGLMIMLRTVDGFSRQSVARACANVRALRTMLVLNHNIFLRTLCLILTFGFFTRQGARQGDIILAANAVLLNFQTLMALGLDGFANALEALVGRAIGARDRLRLLVSIKSGTYLSVLLAVVFSLAFLSAGGIIIDWLTDLMSIRRAAREYLPWMVLSPLISVWCFVLDGIFIGAARGREMRNSMLLSTFGVFLPAWYFLQPWGNHGLWAAFLLFMIMRGISLAGVLLRLHHKGQLMPDAD